MILEENCGYNDKCCSVLCEPLIDNLYANKTHNVNRTIFFCILSQVLRFMATKEVYFLLLRHLFWTCRVEIIRIKNKKEKNWKRME